MKAYWGVEIKLRSYNFGSRYRNGQIQGLTALSLGREIPVSMEAG